MPYEFKTIRRVEFHETDAAGIMHFSNYFHFMEATEQAFYRSIGFRLRTGNGKRDYGMPRVWVECSYAQPLRFQDEVEVHLLIKEVGSKGIHYAFTFLKRVGRHRIETACGEMKVVCVTANQGVGRMRPTSIPATVRSKLRAAPPRLLGL